ncbi:MAG: CDP-glucose 4,6-dehydratase, partial [Candidatus Omnitrophica bacterium]|nr:CDP-glucose 4,6-dehydratase [Candidatus Omnitrophota bacterium]
MKNTFWKNKKVLITGHTGFKGSWLCLWLNSLGAHVTGYALDPPTKPSLFELCRINSMVRSVIADIRDIKSLKNTVLSARPEIVIHMAAQPIVRDSYKKPLETYSTNLMGTINLLEVLRNYKGVKAVINVTSDKCYENKERLSGYCENDPLGGYDPYSSSKACSELITAAYRNSFFNPNEYQLHGVAIATARAGNVIGGGDWAQDRLIPDCLRAILKGIPVIIRNPRARRPWQHVLEPLAGYLVLAQKLYQSGPRYGQAWNFGPAGENIKSVEWIVARICRKFSKNASYNIDKSHHPHEATYLKINCSKARRILGWKPIWGTETAINKIVSWI